MTTTTRKKNPTETLTAFIALMNAVIQGINANLQSGKAVTFNAVSTTWGGVVQVFQTFINDYQAALAAKQAVKEAVAAQTASKAAAVTLLKAVEAALISQYGSSAYQLFGFPAPKPKAAQSTAGKAVSASKTKSTKAAKQIALSAFTGVSHEESSTSLIDSAVAAAPAVAAPALSSVAPAAVAAAPAASPGK